MNVKLISITKPFGDLKHLSPEELITYIARVSNPKNQLNLETAPKLLKYCIKHKHWSIFEQVSLTFEIKTSRAIAAQLLRHKSFCFQEFSQRYQKVQTFETYDARRQDTKNRQNSIDNMSEKDKNWFLDVQNDVHEYCEMYYEKALEKGIAKECARFLLPSSTSTTLYMTGNVRSWITYIMVRTDPSTQQEHIEIAKTIKKKFIEQFPNISEALEWN